MQLFRDLGKLQSIKLRIREHIRREIKIMGILMSECMMWLEEIILMFYVNFVFKFDCFKYARVKNVHSKYGISWIWYDRRWSWIN